MAETNQDLPSPVYSSSTPQTPEGATSPTSHDVINRRGLTSQDVTPLYADGDATVYVHNNEDFSDDSNPVEGEGTGGTLTGEDLYEAEEYGSQQDDLEDTLSFTINHFSQVCSISLRQIRPLISERSWKWGH